MARQVCSKPGVAALSNREHGRKLSAEILVQVRFELRVQVTFQVTLWHLRVFSLLEGLKYRRLRV